MQAVAPVVDTYCPPGHDLQEIKPAESEYWPARQLVQLDAPVDAMKKPAAQEMQESRPEVEYWPVPHEVHVLVAEIGAYVPAGLFRRSRRETKQRF